VDLTYFRANEVSSRCEICSDGQTDTVNRKIARGRSLIGINNWLKMVSY
jgi:hypothetical protein